MALRSSFPFIEVEGSSYEMGYQHGAQGRYLIERFLRLIDYMTQLPRDELCRNALSYLPSIEALSPQYVAEVRGLADGAGISF